MIVYPMMLWICLCVALLIAALAWRARKTIGWLAFCLLVASAIAASIAAGDVRLRADGVQRFTVLVDISDSTRGAEYRDAVKLRHRLGQLLGKHPYEIREFGNEDPPGAEGPVVLLSDGNIDLSHGASAVWPVIDPQLALARDARVLSVRQERGQVVAVVENTGGQRTADVDGQSVMIPAGRSRVMLGNASQNHRIAIEPADLWPENDAAESLQWPARSFARWSVGVPPLDAQGLKAASALPDNPAGYLSVSVLAIDAASATTLDGRQQRAIGTWVRDMGGTLIIVGGDASWSLMRGSTLGELSPLAADPPEPTSQWVVLLDFSGSMAAGAPETPKWRRGVDAANAFVRTLPQRDLVRLGSFAESTTWWSDGPAGQLNLEPPASLRARGPTNLQAALEQAINSDGGKQQEIVLLTDAEVELPKSESLLKQMKANRTRVHCLLLSDGRGAALLEGLCRASGGVLLPERDPGRWADAAKRLARDIAPSRWNMTRVEARTDRPLAVGTLQIAGWNSAWLHDGARPFAWSGDRVLAAEWQIELGRVATFAWQATQEDLLAVAAALEQRPMDPAFTVTWPDIDGRIVIDLDAQAKLAGEVGVRVARAGDRAAYVTMLRETAPGRYEGDLDVRDGAYLTVLADGTAVARGAVPPRYPKEFERIGVDRAKLQSIAAESGGEVIEGDGPITSLPKQRWVSLRGWAGAAAVALLAGAIMQLRRRL